VHEVGDQPRLYYDARSTNHQVDLHDTSELIFKVLFINGLSLCSKFFIEEKENTWVHNNYSCNSDNEFCSIYGGNLCTMLREIMPVYYIKLRVRYMKITKQVSSYVRNNTMSNVHNKPPFVSKPNQPIFNRNAKERQQIKKLKASNISNNRQLNKLLLSDDQKINLITHSGSKSIRVIKW